MTDDRNITELSTGNKVLENKPAVSVVIPHYNSARFISESLDSVLAQTFTDLELIVVNDASLDTQELLKVIQPYRGKIVFIDLTANVGAAAARNIGVENARGDLIGFLDADDIWQPTFLAKMASFLKSSDFDMVYTAAETFGEGQTKRSDLLNKNPPQGEISRGDLIEGKCMILPSGVLIRRSTFLAMNGFDPRIELSEDFDLWMRMTFAGKRIGYLHKLLFRYRVRKDSLSGDSIRRINSSRSIWIALRDKLPFTDDEKRVINQHIVGADADISRTNAMICLVQKTGPEPEKIYVRRTRLHDRSAFRLGTD